MVKGGNAGYTMFAKGFFLMAVKSLGKVLGLN